MEKKTFTPTEDTMHEGAAYRVSAIEPGATETDKPLAIAEKLKDSGWESVTDKTIRETLAEKILKKLDDKEKASKTSTEKVDETKTETTTEETKAEEVKELELSPETQKIISDLVAAVNDLNTRLLDIEDKLKK